jgi:flagellar L-ring protein precursor FlgH
MMLKLKCLVAVLVAMTAMSAPADSLFKQSAGRWGNPIANKRPKLDVGDIVTVMVREVTDASTQSNTNTKKESDVSAQANPTANGFLTATRQQGGFDITNASKLPNWDIQLENEHKGTGQTKRTNKLTTAISCLVTEVNNDNGTVSIKGEKKVAVNREFSILSVSGMVRTRDIGADNTISSSQIANANIELKGRGPLWNNQRRGWFKKILDWFSPF